MTGAINAQERRDVGSFDVPNAFIQTLMGLMANGSRKIVCLTDDAVNLLCKIDPSFTTYVVYVEFLYKSPHKRHKNVKECAHNVKRIQKVMYCSIKRAIYGMVTAALQWYRQWHQDLLWQGFDINPYDPCVANKTVDGQQLTVVWHVDDGKVSHVNPDVITRFIDWVDRMYGDDKLGHVTSVCGKVHDYLGMVLDYSEPGIL